MLWVGEGDKTLFVVEAFVKIPKGQKKRPSEM